MDKEKLQGKTKEGRVGIRFEVPKEIVDAGNPFKTITLVILKTSESLMVTRMVSPIANQAEMMDALMRQAVRQIDDNGIAVTSAEFEKLWDNMHPKVKQLLRDKVNELMTPTRKEQEDFLSSQQYVTL